MKGVEGLTLSHDGHCAVTMYPSPSPSPSFGLLVLLLLRAFCPFQMKTNNCLVCFFLFLCKVSLVIWEMCSSSTSPAHIKYGQGPLYSAGHYSLLLPIIFTARTCYLHKCSTVVQCLSRRMLNCTIGSLLCPIALPTAALPSNLLFSLQCHLPAA